MQSKASSVKEYLQSLPADRRSALETLRKIILTNLDKGFEEGMQYGMIGYYVPHRIYPNGYHCDPKQPLPFAGLASQKNHISLYMMSCYENGPEGSWLKQAWTKAGKKLNMGKCCIRFTKLEDVPLEVVGEAFRRVTASKYIEFYESVIRTKNKASSRKPAKPGVASRTKKQASASKKRVAKTKTVRR